MSRLTRRDFLKGSLLGAGAYLSMGMAGSSEDKDAAIKSSDWNGFRYAMCNESMRGINWRQQCQIIAEAGYEAVEIAAFTLVNEGVGEITSKQRSEMVKVMEEAGIQCAGLHWLLAPPPNGLHFTTPDESTRRKTVAYLNELIDFCGDLGGSVMVFGSPKQRNTVGCTIGQAKEYFAEGLISVADHAQKRSVRILVEPLDKSQTDVVNTMDEGMEILKRINHPAIELMFDFHNTPDETEAFDVLVKKFYEHIFHVHVQEMDGKYLGAGTAAEDYVKTFQVLKDMGYSRWVSLEVFDFSPGGRKIAEESMKTLRLIESKLI